MLIQSYRKNLFKYLISYSQKRRNMSLENCKVAVCQLTTTNNKESNLNSVKKLVAEAAAEHAKVCDNYFQDRSIIFMCIILSIINR